MSRTLHSPGHGDALADAGPHPLCPGCGYDLIGSVRAKRRICPECGRKFSRHELLPGARPWTPGRGLRSAAWALGLRALVAFPFGFVVTHALGLWLTSPPYGGVLLLLAVAGLGLGAWLGRGLADVAGQRSFSLTALATAFAWVTVAAGVGASALLRRPDGWTEVYALHTTAIFATFWIVRATLLSD